MKRPTYHNKWASVLVKLNKYPWFNKASSQALQQSLDRMFKKFFEKQASYPKFKKKKFFCQTFCVPQHIQFYIKEDNPKYSYIELLEYKAKRCEIEVIKASRYYPSSQMCSECGYINKEVKDLSVREWICPVCRVHHDRGVNAAKNLARYGLMLQ
ncbi:transposase [Thermotoga sp. 38H-to]|uniref:transposase n=1 Tax=Thermotoga sp. 38H-to TaxID=1755812 RepID=UPI0016A8CE4D|nr:transposase [Thermotoga sp. 38H-to]KAF2960747.1 hypothetical protein AS158_03615 [Thermotoga sp. 38H-to]